MWEIPEDQRGDTWGNDVLLAVRDLGCFVRVLVPIALTGGYTVTFGVWLSVHPDSLRRAWEVWWKPDYSGLELEGVLANALPPWREQTYRRWALARVRSPDEVPYIASSPDRELAAVLSATWSHDAVLPHLPR